MLRDSRLCLLSALVLAVLGGCNNPAQPPLYDPFGPTTVPPPGTATAPSGPYLNEDSLPSSRRPGNRTSQTTPAADDDPNRQWRPSQRGRLASAELEEEGVATAAGAEITDEEINQADAAVFEEEPAPATEKSSKTARRSSVSIRADQLNDGGEVNATLSE